MSKHDAKLRARRLIKKTRVLKEAALVSRNPEHFLKIEALRNAASDLMEYARS